MSLHISISINKEAATYARNCETANYRLEIIYFSIMRSIFMFCPYLKVVREDSDSSTARLHGLVLGSAAQNRDKAS